MVWECVCVCVCVWRDGMNFKYALCWHIHIYQFIPYTPILKPFEASEPTGLKVYIAITWMQLKWFKNKAGVSFSLDSKCAGDDRWDYRSTLCVFSLFCWVVFFSGLCVVMCGCVVVFWKRGWGSVYTIINFFLDHLVLWMFFNSGCVLLIMMCLFFPSA